MNRFIIVLFLTIEVALARPLTWQMSICLLNLSLSFPMARVRVGLVSRKPSISNANEKFGAHGQNNRSHLPPTRPVVSTTGRNSADKSNNEQCKWKICYNPRMICYNPRMICYNLRTIYSNMPMICYVLRMVCYNLRTIYSNISMICYVLRMICYNLRTIYSNIPMICYVLRMIGCNLRSIYTGISNRERCPNTGQPDKNKTRDDSWSGIRNFLDLNLHCSTNDNQWPFRPPWHDIVGPGLWTAAA